MWNTNGYQQPSGVPTTSGYPKQYGFGHEEWNGSEKRLWRGYRVFHTETTDKLRDLGKNGELGLLMIASHGGKQYATAIAVGVYPNSQEEQKLIAEESDFKKLWSEAWAVQTVQKAFRNDKNRFLEHWNREYSAVKWKCADKLYYQWSTPVEMNIGLFTKKKRLVTHFARHQCVYPQQIDKFLSDYLEPMHPIRKWLRATDFDNSLVNKNVNKSRYHTKPHKRQNFSNAPAETAYTYWVEGNRSVEPKHAFLQGKFCQWLIANGYKYEENKDYVDVRYHIGNSLVFAEVKPTETVSPKYAIRIAIGQLFEYRFRLNHQGKLAIVISSEPAKEDVAFVQSLGITLIYYSDRKDRFIQT